MISHAISFHAIHIAHHYFHCCLGAPYYLLRTPHFLPRRPQKRARMKIASRHDGDVGRSPPEARCLLVASVGSRRLKPKVGSHFFQIPAGARKTRWPIMFKLLYCRAAERMPQAHRRLPMRASSKHASASIWLPHFRAPFQLAAPALISRRRHIVAWSNQRHA